MRVYIAQCLCPNRHAILAAAGEAENDDKAQHLIPKLATSVRGLLDDGLNPWCGICHAKAETWRYELGRTPYTTMAEAQPHLDESERQNIAAGILFGELLGPTTKH